MGDKRPFGPKLFRESLVGPVLYLSCLVPSWFLSGTCIQRKKDSVLFVCYVYECLACIDICVPCVCSVPGEDRKGNRSPGTAVTEGCEPSK